MNTKLVYVLGLIAIIAIAGCFLPIGGKTVIDRTVGAVSGPDIYFPYMNFNGVTSWFTSASMVSATNTPIAIKTSQATSTLDRITCNVLNGSLGDVLYISTSTSAVATTSSPALKTFTVTASVPSNFHWETVGGGIDDNVLVPNTYILVRTASTTPTSLAIKGTCKVKTTEF